MKCFYIIFHSGNFVGNFSWQSFTGDFDLVAACKEAEVRGGEGSIVTGWYEISHRQFIEFGKYCETHAYVHKPKLYLVHELKAPPAGIEPVLE